MKYLQFNTDPRYRSDQGPAFQASLGTTVCFTDKIIPKVPQKHYRISVL